jgi:hypothetical protein
VCAFQEAGPLIRNSKWARGYAKNSESMELGEWIVPPSDQISIVGGQCLVSCEDEVRWGSRIAVMARKPRSCL